MTSPMPITAPATASSSLCRIISAHAPTTGDFGTPIGNLSVYRRNEPAPLVTCIVEPSIVLVVQGAKELVIGSDAYPYDTSRFLVTSLNIPATSAVTTASEAEPCLGLVLKLDLRMLAELIAQDGRLPVSNQPVNGSAGVGTLSPKLMEGFRRLIELLEEPDAIPVLGPLIQREIHYRLLLSDQAPLLRSIASVGSKGHRIAKAIDWMKLNYAAPLRVEELASQVQMGLSTFHQHFRQLTAMSPLQYQKWLRLNEAKRLMLNENLDAATAGFKVGYESPSQFSREYGRQFGIPPKRDIAELRQSANRPESNGR
ncbi:AraC family transcriptional regulator [Pseudomonas sp. FW305-E2]|uniref:AraC family transcriptional regulator n=1 Tax=Pseudomonas sp. FW305-E2 TaxID=2075558 RepID=UPI000B4EA488|nr:MULTISPECIES: AraC family transcriptional regulator [Pseudomonas]POA81046.1 AraC family transcriptional regulator [Pseudomonas sp. FW305-E2]